jgi:rfaE bifunctional protein nucleotidyltransferase chain/domain
MSNRPDFLKAVQEKILTVEELQKVIEKFHFFGRKIVFTNGCFDLLHYGHIEYLAKAASLGDFFVIGLNTDASVKRQNKSPERPINNEYTRAMMLASLHFVSSVVLFSEETPYELIKKLQPDVLVKGSDYKPEQIVGYDVVKARGGEVVTISLVEGFSTTGIVEKLKGFQ